VRTITHNIHVHLRCRISETFYFDLNSDKLLAMVPLRNEVRGCSACSKWQITWLVA
jgi:hypothetical protein